MEPRQSIARVNNHQRDLKRYNMEINTKDDVDALMAVQTIRQIQQPESKIHRLSYEPIWIFISLTIYAFGTLWLEFVFLYTTVLVLACAMTLVSKNNVQRIALLRQRSGLQRSSKP